jgi:hypothetical protein
MSLQQILADGTQMLARLDHLTGRCQPLADPALMGNLQILAGTVRTLLREAHQPVRVGLVGAFNAGKTRLLEALLGCAGRLNVVDKPSTGNIVEFVLRTGDVPQTQLDGWKVVFLSEQAEAAGILRRLLAEARDQQNREGFGQGGDADLHRRLLEAEFGENERPRWAKAQEWAVLAHAKARAKQFKAVAFEVYRLAYTVGQAAPWLGREFDLTEPDAIRLMSLDYDPQEVFQRELAQWQVRAPEVPTGKALAGIPPAGLKALFPIVRKILVTATLPPAVAAPFGGPGGVDVRLVDCPGAGADGSNFRDGVLCARELRDVDTVFALLNAKNPGENRQFIDDLLRLWGPAAKDRILAVVSRFDQLPHDQNQSKGRRDALADAPGPLTQRQLLEEIDTLGTLYKAAADTVMDREPARICFVSAMGYLSERLQEEGAGRRGTPEFYRRELGFAAGGPTPDQSHQPWVREMVQWFPVARRLREAADPDSHALADLLDELASDGGFTRLHRTLQRHLAQHGQANKLARLTPERDQAARALAELEGEVTRRAQEAAAAPPPPRAEPAAPLERPEALAELARAYHLLEQKWESRAFDLVRRPPGGLQAAPIRDPVRRWAVSLILRWREWRLLFQRIRPAEPGLVKLVDPNAPDLAAFPAARQEEQETPVRSDQFLKPFLETLAGVQAVLRERCQGAMTLHGETLRQELEAELGGAAGLQRVRAGLGGEAAGTLAYALNPVEGLASTAWLDQRLPPLAPAEDKAPHFAAYFPLQHGGPGQPLYYAWHQPLYQRHLKQFDARHRHLMYVLKLRQVLIDASLRWLDDALHAVRREMERAIKDQVKRLAGELRAEVARQPIIEPPVGPAD